MTVLYRSLKPMLARVHAHACSAFVRMSVWGSSPERDFGRIAVVAPLQRHNGIASGARLQHAMLRRMGFEAELVDATPALRNPLFRARHQPASTYIVHCGGPQTSQLLCAVMPAAARAWRIGYWAWELPDPPADWRGHDAPLHEVWVPSRFTRDSLRRLTHLPVQVVPHVVPAAASRRRRRDGPFTVLCLGDSRSSLARKNPAGALAAFRAAFGDSLDARLIIKLTGPPGECRELECAVADCANVTILREFLDPSQLTALFRSTDALLSLHRAEGFGLPMLEAMAQGVPVVATGWSGNCDFMDASNALLVPAHLVPVEDSAGIYRDGVWAEPDLDMASAALRALADDPQRWERLSIASHASAELLARRRPSALLQLGARRDRLRAVVAARIARATELQDVQGERG